MNNEPTESGEPVAWMLGDDWFADARYYEPQKGDIPLYTHPAKTLTDDPLVNFKPVWQEKPELTLTDEEIIDIALKEVDGWVTKEHLKNFAKAILRKAQEK